MISQRAMCGQSIISELNGFLRINAETAIFGEQKMWRSGRAPSTSIPFNFGAVEGTINLPVGIFASCSLPSHPALSAMESRAETSNTAVHFYR